MKDTIKCLVDISVDVNRSEAIQLPEWARKASINLPILDSGNQVIEFIKEADVTTALLLASNNTSWIGVQTAIDSAGNLGPIFNAGAGVDLIDISALIRGLGHGYIRLFCSANQLADRIITIHFTD
jgi:hypothetical protein